MAVYAWGSVETTWSTFRSGNLRPAPFPAHMHRESLAENGMFDPQLFVIFSKQAKILFSLKDYLTFP